MRILVVFLLVFNGLGAQKVVEKSLIDQEATLVRIDAAECFQLSMDTSDTHDIRVEATIDGEYEKNLALNIKNVGTTTVVSTGFLPNFIKPNDKLSAHKVISISLKIILPKNKNVQVYGAGCNVFVSGAYRSLKVILNDGKCVLFNVSESADVLTQSGDITIHSRMAKIWARSKYGVVDATQIPKGNNHFMLRTITGDIHLRKTE